MNLNPDRIGRDRLQEVSFDPFGLMPGELPPHPRVWATSADLARTRRLVKARKWARVALERLLSSAEELSDLPEALPVPADHGLNAKIIRHAEHNVLAHLLTGQRRRLDAALAAFRLIAHAYPGWDITPGLGRAYAQSLSETKMTCQLGRTYDLLAAAGLEESDDVLFRALLAETRPTIDAQPHYACGNHNTWGIAATLSVAAALGDRQGIHDALYGFDSAGNWRYGLVHQLRHDLLADGLHWERAPGYHFYTLMGLVELARMLANIGVDIWHAELPVQMESDGRDLHRAYGPAGKTKCLKSVFDAPFYQMFANGDLPLLHDSGLANLRGAWIWGPLYEFAYEVYGDPKYAWLLRRIEKEYTEREHPGLPMSLHASRGVEDFVRLTRVSFPKARFSHAEDARIAVTGRHEHGCSLFPTHGSALLRSDPADGQAPAVWMFWGPHSAGHQAPAALHIDVHALGRRVTDAPRSTGYGDPMHLSWLRTTVAHNTVTVDGSPMFPYDQGSDSIWEADNWRERPSDGMLELFQPRGPVKALRASNESVYPGVRLDRTVVLTRGFVLDVFRVLSRAEHQYDWAMHCLGSLAVPPHAAEAGLEGGRGYGHFADPRRLPGQPGPVHLEWDCGGSPTFARIVVPQDGEVIAAEDPEPPDQKELGELEEVVPRSTVLVRARGDNVLFTSLWQFGAAGADLRVIQGEPDGDVVLDVAEQRILLPMSQDEVRTRQRHG